MVLVFVARPVAAFAATLRTDLAKGERAFIGWMAQRGIVAAATASTFGAVLAVKGIGGAANSVFRQLRAFPLDHGGVVDIEQVDATLGEETAPTAAGRALPVPGGARNMR